MGRWKTWSDVWDMMIVEEWLIRIYPRWTMHQRIASESLDVEVPDMMEKGKWIFNLKNQSSLEVSHISKCQSLLNQDINWFGDQKRIIWFQVLQVTTYKSKCQSNITCGNPYEVKKEVKWQQPDLCKLKLKKCIWYLILSIGITFY
jgi:hypothetical protein